MPIDFLRLRSMVSFFTGAALAVLQAGCGAGVGAGPGADSASDSAGLVGNPAPDFSVDTVTGARRAVSLQALRGNVVLVDFWGTYCGPCKQSFPKLQNLSEAYSGRGLRIVGVSEDEPDDKDKIATFAANYGAKFAIGWDEDKVIAHRYKPEVMPSTYIIDKKGVVRFVHVGFHDGDEVSIRKEVEALLAQ